MTAAEERVLRAAKNPWPLSVWSIARGADRSQATVDRHLSTLRRNGLVNRYTVNGKRAYMTTDAGDAALSNVDRMRAEGTA